MADEGGFLSLEWVLTLPVVALLVAGLLLVGSVVRDALVLQEAARTAARAAAVTADDAAVAAVARDAAPELDHLTVIVHPPGRRVGQQVTVTARTTVRYGPVSRELTARSVALVEPVVTGRHPAGLPGHGWVPGPSGPTAPRGAGSPPASPAPSGAAPSGPAPSGPAPSGPAPSGPARPDAPWGRSP